MTTQRLAGRTALVTGGTGNIGEAIAHALAGAGARVALTGRDVERGERVVATVRATGGRAEFVRADLDGSVDRSLALADDVLARFDGHLDILVNNAGIFPGHTTASADGSLFDQIYGTNVKAPFFLTQGLVPAMIAGDGGAIVNLGSWVSRLGVASSPLYSSSKAALEALTRAWAAEWGPKGIRVNAVSPGVIRPTALPADQQYAGEQLMIGTPAGRAGTATAIAAGVVYLASDDAAFVHGTVLDVDGGRVGVAVSAN